MKPIKSNHKYPPISLRQIQREVSEKLEKGEDKIIEIESGVVHNLVKTFKIDVERYCNNPLLNEFFGGVSNILVGYENMKIQNAKLVEENKKLLVSSNPKEVESLNLEILKLKNEIKTILEELGNKVLELSKKNEVMQEQNQQMKNKQEQSISSFKDFVIDNHLGGNQKYQAKSLNYLLDLIEEIKERSLEKIEEAEEEPIEEESETDEEESNESEESFDWETYIETERCLCGESKYYGARSCKNCKKIADKLRKRKGISWEEAWEEWRKTL